MRNLFPITGDTVPHFTSIIFSKDSPRRERLILLTNFISESYAEYQLKINQLETLLEKPLPDETRQDLLHTYDFSTNALGALKTNIKRHNFNSDPYSTEVCQYCGISKGRTFDHYLPKRKFPHFAVCAINLLPCCSTCNNLKNETWLDITGKREIISFYYDLLPDTNFLTAEVTIEEDSPTATYNLSESAADYAGLETTIRNHFKHLDLLQRFREESPSVFSEIKSTIARDIRNGGLPTAQAALEEDAHELAKKRSINDWKVQLKLAMRNSLPFLHWCTTHD